MDCCYVVIGSNKYKEYFVVEDWGTAACHIRHNILNNPRCWRGHQGNDPMLLVGTPGQRHKPINPSTYKPINPSTYQPINLSTYKPINPSTYQPINHLHGKIKSGTEELFVVILHPNPDTITQIMKFNPIIIFILALSLYSLPSFGQSEKEPEGLGLPGDNLDLYAVLDIFQKSKTIEDFEKTLNDEKTAVNNLDLNLDNKVDFIKVVTEQEGDDFSFILQVPISEKETQDVAVILVSKDEKEKITMQIVGDKELYGENYIIEPQATTSPASTVNPGYTGDDPVTESTPATTKIVYVESAPIVKYVYSPVYVPYYPPYYYGYYPPYYNPFIVPIAFGVYWGNHYHYHGYGYGYGHTTVIINHNHYHNYNNHRNYSNTVYNNRTNGSYNKNVGKPRPSTGTSPSTRPSTCLLYTSHMDFFKK